MQKARCVVPERLQGSAEIAQGRIRSSLQTTKAAPERELATRWAAVLTPLGIASPGTCSSPFLSGEISPQQFTLHNPRQQSVFYDKSLLHPCISFWPEKARCASNNNFFLSAGPSFALLHRCPRGPMKQTPRHPEWTQPSSSSSFIWWSSTNWWVAGWNTRSRSPNPRRNLDPSGLLGKSNAYFKGKRRLIWDNFLKNGGYVWETMRRGCFMHWILLFLPAAFWMVTIV